MDHDDELQVLEQYIEEARAKFSQRHRLRELNCPANISYPDDETLGKLDLSIKKNSAFVKRLKVFTESQKTQILDDIDRLNLDKFISEVAASLIETKLKISDIPSVIEICTKLNQTYRHFSKHLLDQFSKYFPSIKKKLNDSQNPSSNNSNQSTTNHSVSPTTSLVKQQVNKNAGTASVSLNPSKIRVDLRLFTELIIAGVLPIKESFPVLVNLLRYLMIYDRNVYQNSNAILTFCKGCGDEILGLVPLDVQRLAEKFNKELPTTDIISQKRQQLLKSYFRDYYYSLQKHLGELYEELGRLVTRNNKVCRNKGEISKESKELVEIKKVELQKVQNVVNQLSELLGEEPIEIPNSDILNKFVEEDNFALDTTQEEGLVDSHVSCVQTWDDDGTRSFYEDLLDLKALFPNLQVKIKVTKKKADSPQAKSKCDVAGIGNKPTSSPVESQKSDANSAELDKTMSSSSASSASFSSSSSSSSEGEEDESSAATESKTNHLIKMSQKVANRTQPEQYFLKLSNCVNRDVIDNAAIDFIRFYNTKFGRKKLVKTLFNVQRTRLDLLPFYARLTATIHPYVPRVGSELTNQLKQDFRNLFRKKDQINIESKVKNVRFIGELVKFNLYPRSEALSCLKMLLSDFTHHHIEMTCNLLETCGRFLYTSPESYNQLRLILEQMMRKKLLLSVDSKYVTMIENAYYFTNPPEVIRHVVEEPPIHIYVRYLLCECLNRTTIETVVQKFKLLNWNDKVLAKFVINCMIGAYDLKFYNIRYLTALLAALNKGYPWISIAVVDGVVEDILLMMEINEIQFNQRRIPMIRYLGELYNYRLADSSLVFKILYSLITYGVQYPEPNLTLNQIPMSQLDPPDNLFRIKLVCDLLDTCGHFLSSGQEKKKLDCYLLFFQRYYWCKRHIYMLNPYCMSKSGNQFPASTQYLFNDAISNLRPSFQMAKSYPEAIQSLQAFIDSLKND